MEARSDRSSSLRRGRRPPTGTAIVAPSTASAQEESAVRRLLPDPDEPGISSSEKRKRTIVLENVPKLTAVGDRRQLDNKLNLEWSNKLAGHRANEIVSIWGYQPTAIGTGKDGLAIWQNIPGYDEIKIDGNVARATVHEDPAQHADFFYASVKIQLPADLRDTVRDISQSITYNELRGTVTAGCHFLGAALATLSLVKQYATREITLARAQHEYGRLIKKTAGELAAAEKSLAQRVPEDVVAEYRKHLTQTFIEEEYVTGSNAFRDGISATFIV